MKRSCEYIREEAMKIIVLKRKNEVIDKRAVEITWKCKNLLYWSRKNLKKNMRTIKNIVKVETIAIIKK